MTIYQDYYRDTFTNPLMQKIFSEESRFQSWLKTEASLAKVQSELGLIPKKASENILKMAKVKNLDLCKLKEQYKVTGFPILPLVKQLTSLCDNESAKWVHWGATTQDIIDTGASIQMKAGLSILEADLVEIANSILDLSEKHRNTVMAGRTFKQHASPITFGFKASIWLDEIRRHLERLKHIKKNALLCSYGGAVGNLAALGDDGIEVANKLADDLGLEHSSISWHTSRDGWTELVFWLALASATLSKIASEISTLMSTEVNEVREPYKKGRGASSAMPQKRNPISCPIIISNANRLRDLLSSQLSAMNQDHERALAGQSLEWLIIPDAFLLASGVFMHSKEILADLEVDSNIMLKNLKMGGGLIMSEAVKIGLAKKIGRKKAHKLVSDAATKALENNIDLSEALAQSQEITSEISEDKMKSLFNVNNYLGSTHAMIDQVQARYKNLKSSG